MLTDSIGQELKQGAGEMYFLIVPRPLEPQMKSLNTEVGGWYHWKAFLHIPVVV